MGCSGAGHDRAVLREVGRLASVAPETAMAMLDSVDYGSLSESDRHYYDLMSVKVRDKAYVTHESDSLIRDVISYYESHKDNGIYPEALYYGGRVYSDMGDYPTALSYFQRALDEKTDNLDLKSKMLSQTSRLLNKLRLYDEAVPYLAEAIDINIGRRDTLAMVYDYQLLGAIYIHDNKLDSAAHCFNRAMDLGKNLPPEHNAKSKMYLATIKYKSQQYDSAAVLIRNIHDNVDYGSRNTALAYTAEIYLATGMIDSAYIYAQELINSKDFNNREVGCYILLSDEMRDYVRPDTLNQYLREYMEARDTHFDERKFQLATMQQSLYNYQLHERERIKAERAKDNLRNWIVGGCFILLIMSVVILYLRVRHKNTLLQLHIALNNVTVLKQRIESASINTGISDKTADFAAEENVPVLRKRLREELLAIYQENGANDSISDVILQSAAYKELQDLIVQEKALNDSSPLWDELESLVENASPNFKTYIRLLTGGKLTSQEFHTALLIKCGVTPSQMVILFSRSKGTISSRRESLCFKVFDEKMGTKVIDGIIRLL